ncbi:hypothetical protein KC926_01640 [Candidatus Kaiserbacteria bacterium]|nr:hypothetical protein [Candidatus Kaiserbacteria bacterium]
MPSLHKTFPDLANIVGHCSTLVASHYHENNSNVQATDVSEGLLSHWTINRGILFLNNLIDHVPTSGIGQLALFADTLNGEKSFKSHTPTATVTAVLLRQDDVLFSPVAAVIQNPVTGEVWSAIKNNFVKYSFKPSYTPRNTRTRLYDDNDPIRVAICQSKAPDLAFSRFSSAIAGNSRFEVIHTDSTGHYAGALALGQLDAVICPKLDAATLAGALIAYEAGATVGNMWKALYETGFTLDELRAEGKNALPNGVIMAANLEIASIIQKIFLDHYK